MVGSHLWTLHLDTLKIRENWRNDHTVRNGINLKGTQLKNEKGAKNCDAIVENTAYRGKNINKNSKTLKISGIVDGPLNKSLCHHNHKQMWLP